MYAVATNALNGALPAHNNPDNNLMKSLAELQRKGMVPMATLQCRSGWVWGGILQWGGWPLPASLHPPSALGAVIAPDIFILQNITDCAIRWRAQTGFRFAHTKHPGNLPSVPVWVLGARLKSWCLWRGVSTINTFEPAKWWLRTSSCIRANYKIADTENFNINGWYKC